MLLSKENQSLPVPTQFLCQFSNISECLPIEGQDNVSEIISKNCLSIKCQTVYIDYLESNNTTN